MIVVNAIFVMRFYIAQYELYCALRCSIKRHNIVSWDLILRSMKSLDTVSNHRMQHDIMLRNIKS